MGRSHGAGRYIMSFLGVSQCCGMLAAGQVQHLTMTGGIGTIRQIILVLSILRGAVLLYRCCCVAGSLLRASCVTFHPRVRGNKYE